jgi:hypothetical protein
MTSARGYFFFSLSLCTLCFPGQNKRKTQGILKWLNSSSGLMGINRIYEKLKSIKLAGLTGIQQALLKRAVSWFSVLNIASQSSNF